MPRPLSVEPVTTAYQRRDWLSLPWKVNGSDPNWVPPLRDNQRRLAGFAEHPVWADGEGQAFLAMRGPEPVGRVLAVVNHAHNRFHEDRVGFFGFFECFDDQEAADGLLGVASDWLRERDRDVARGPMNPTLNYEVGLLVEGFDTPPYFLLTHNPPYYDGLVRGAGFDKAHDLYGYWGDVSMLDELAQDQKLRTVDQMVRDRFGVNVRAMRPDRFTEELETFLRIYNDALTETWGYVPMSREEVVHFGGELRRLLVPELARMAEVDGKPVGAVFGLLDYNARIKAIDGRLFPLGWAKLLANKRAIKRIRIVSTNVLPEYQSWGVGISLVRSLLEPALAHGIDACEFSWVLESNDLSRKSIEKGGARRYKTWRVYDKPLG
ncbi:MAG: N-acetyltransferase [Planctomycetota bacterium]